MNTLRTTVDRITITGRGWYELDEAMAWIGKNGYTLSDGGGDLSWLIVYNVTDDAGWRVKAEKPHTCAPALKEAA